MNILSIQDVQQETYSTMFGNGSPARFLGFPSQDGQGMSINTTNGLELAMVSGKNEEGAWSVISYALSDAFAQKASNIGISARKCIVQDVISEAVDVDVDGYTEEHGVMLLNLIDNATEKYTWNSLVEEIVNEEIPAYFSGDKTAEDTAKIIQNRVSIYLSEQS